MTDEFVAEPDDAWQNDCAPSRRRPASRCGFGYKKAAYGPYAENLRHVMSEVEGHLLTGYGDGGDQPNKALELVPGAVEAAHAFLAQHPDTVTRFERVATLVESFESPFGMELLASVHWVATRELVSAPQDIVRAVHAWSPASETCSTSGRSGSRSSASPPPGGCHAPNAQVLRPHPSWAISSRDRLTVWYDTYCSG